MGSPRGFIWAFGGVGDFLGGLFFVVLGFFFFSSGEVFPWARGELKRGKAKPKNPRGAFSPGAGAGKKELKPGKRKGNKQEKQRETQAESSEFNPILIKNKHQKGSEFGRDPANSGCSGVESAPLLLE